MGVDGILVGFPVAPQDKEPSPVLQWVFINLNHCVSFYVAKAPLAVVIKNDKNVELVSFSPWRLWKNPS